MTNYTERLWNETDVFSPPDRFLPAWPPAGYSSWVWRSSAWPRGGLYPSFDCPPYPPLSDWLLGGNDRHYVLGIRDNIKRRRSQACSFYPLDLLWVLRDLQNYSLWETPLLHWYKAFSRPVNWHPGKHMQKDQISVTDRHKCYNEMVQLVWVGEWIWFFAI